MSIEDDVALLERVPTLRLLGTTSLRMLAIGSEQRDFARGDVLFSAGDDADAGYIVQRGAFRVEDGGGVEIVAGPGDLDRRACAGGADAATLHRGRAGVFFGDPGRAQPVSAGAGERSRRGAPASRRIRQPHQPDRQRNPDGGKADSAASYKPIRSSPRIYISSVTVTGTWSDGRSQPRASRVIRNR